MSDFDPGGRRRRLILFGDSIACGLGVREERYAELVCAELGLDLVDRSVSGATVRESLDRFVAQASAAEVAVIAHGVTEPIPRPRPSSLRFFPQRWRRRGWMDPRPYYSSRWWKRVLERMESSLRWRFKNIAMALAGSTQLLSIDEYENALTELVARLQTQGTRVIVLGPTGIDERFFPGASDAQRRYAAVAEQLSPTFIALDGTLERWADYFADRFHPNVSGHRKIADQLIARLS